MNQSFLQTTLKRSFLITDTRQTLSDKPAVSARIITTSCCFDDKNLFFSGRIFSENVTILQQWHNINAVTAVTADSGPAETTVRHMIGLSLMLEKRLCLWSLQLQVGHWALSVTVGYSGWHWFQRLRWNPERKTCCFQQVGVKKHRNV